MQSAQSSSSHGALGPTTPVYPDHDLGLVMADDVWPLDPLPMGPRTINSLNFGSIAASWKPDVKGCLWILMNPRSPQAVSARVSVRPRSRGSLTTWLHSFRTLAEFFASPPYPTDGRGPCALDEADYARLLNAVVNRTGRFSTKEPHSAILRALRLLHQLGPALPNGGLSGEPWPGKQFTQLLGLRSADSNSTSVLPWFAFDAFTDGAWQLVDKYSPDVIDGTFVHAGRRRMHEQAAPRIQGPDGRTWTESLRVGWRRQKQIYMIRLLQTAALITIARSTLMRASELNSLTKNSLKVVGGRTLLEGTQFDGRSNVKGELRYWMTTDRVVRAYEVAVALADEGDLIFPSSLQAAQPDHMRRLFGYLAVAPSDRIGGGTELGHERSWISDALIAHDAQTGDSKLDLSNCGKADGELGARTLRQTGAEFMGRRADSSLGLMLQMGHKNLSTTQGYMSGGSGVAKNEWSPRQREILEGSLEDSLLERRVAGPVGVVLERRRKVLHTDAARASYMEHFVDRLHLGVACHCAWDPQRSVCNPGGREPKLHLGLCATDACSNALFTEDHVVFWRLELRKADSQLAKMESTSPFREQLSAQRERIAALLAQIEEQ